MIMKILTTGAVCSALIGADFADEGAKFAACNGHTVFH